jgi:hypothetical protein
MKMLRLLDQSYNYICNLSRQVKNSHIIFS